MYVIKELDGAGRILIPKYIRKLLNSNKVKITVKEVDGKVVIELTKAE